MFRQLNLQTLRLQLYNGDNTIMSLLSYDVREINQTFDHNFRLNIPGSKVHLGRKFPIRIPRKKYIQIGFIAYINWKLTF